MQVTHLPRDPFVRKKELLRIVLLLIPQGYVTTYGSLARVIGTSPRAVGRLLSANEHLIAIPCHRVVMNDGSLGGFSLGQEVKRKLLLLEGVRFNGEKVSKKSMIKIDELLLGSTS